MDLREIQRLHAQFAPDSMTIDLPRQIAALPAPADFSTEEASTKLRTRLAKTTPVIRRCVIAAAIAAVVGMAGMGAATLYRSTGTGTDSHKAIELARKKQGAEAAQPAAQSEAAVRAIDAAPARPVAAAPMLSANNLAGATNVGLTADQFRNSLGTSGGTSIDTNIVEAAPAASNEAQRAAVSPIRQTRRESETSQASAPQAVSAQPGFRPLANAAAQQTSTTAPSAAADAGASSASSTGRTHNTPRHVARARDGQPAESDAPSAVSNKKPASANRAGANEVQMF